MHQIVNTCKAEVGWLGSVKKENDRYLVDDIFLLKQNVTGTTTELDEEAMHDFFNELIMKDPEKYSSIRMWGHSHVQMAVFASNQDDETFKEYYQECPFFIRLIANQKEEMKVDIAVKEDGYIYHDIPWYIQYPQNIVQAMRSYEEALKAAEDAEKKVAEIKENIENSFKEEIDKEIKDKVIERNYYYKKSDKKTSTQSWTKEEMDDYANWYDYYGYYGEDSDLDYYTVEGEILDKCDTGERIKICGKNQTIYQTLTDAFDPFEILELAESCETWKDTASLLNGDERTNRYKEKDWKKLFNVIKETYKEYERRTA
jgi:hypothetical protein